MITIAIIGIDGSGKSTLTQKIKQYFESLGIKNIYCGNLKGQNYYDIKSLIEDNDLSSYITTAAYALDLYHKCMEVQKKQFDVVIWDRYVPCIKVCNPSQCVEQVESIMKKIPKADCTICLDLEPQKALLRINRRGKAKKHENIDFLSSCRDKYLNLGEKDRIFYIDANASEDIVIKNTIKVIKKEMEIKC